MTDAPVTITVCPDGPLLVRGPVAFDTADGEPVANPRNVVALCRCGRSRLKPLCDGSHRRNGFHDDPDATTIEHRMIYASDPPT